MGELQEGYELLGMSIHVITLIGFLTFYGLQRLIWRATLDSVSKQGYIFYIELVFYCVYNYRLQPKEEGRGKIQELSLIKITQPLALGRPVLCS